MIRTQVQLTEEQAKDLRRLAAEQGASVAALVRRAVDHFLDEHAGPSVQARFDRARQVIGAFRSDAASAGRDHDQHLAEIYSNWPRS